MISEYYIHKKPFFLILNYSKVLIIILEINLIKKKNNFKQITRGL